MGKKFHAMHGRDHLPGGSDPIPGLTGNEGAWHNVGDPGEPAFQNGCVNATGEQQLRFRLKANGIDVDIDGAFDPGTSTNIVVFTLPTGFRPLQKVDLVLGVTTDDGFALAEVRTNGDVFYYGMFYGTPGTAGAGSTVGQVVYVNGA